MVTPSPNGGDTPQDKLLFHNAELGEITRMWRIAKARRLRLPFGLLDRAVSRVVFYLLSPKSPSRSAHDYRTPAELVQELAMAYVLLRQGHYPDRFARVLMSDLHNEILKRDSLTSISRAEELIEPSEEIVTDSATAPSRAQLFDPPDPPSFSSHAHIYVRR